MSIFGGFSTHQAGGRHSSLPLMMITAVLLGIACGTTFGADANKPSTTVKPETSFSCQGRPSGYYADIETGCQVYHMCDGLGRQFSYACPNTTLFQQRMLICDHWYMVNCSRAELDYSANLLIGQRDKPFVDDTVQTYNRTPRPDLLVQPYAPQYDDREAKSQMANHHGGNLVGVDNQATDSNGKPEQQYFLPSHWSTELSKLGKDAYTESPRGVSGKPHSEIAQNLLPKSNDNREKANFNVDPPSRLFQPPLFQRTFEGKPNPSTGAPRQDLIRESSDVLQRTALTLNSLKSNNENNRPRNISDISFTTAQSIIRLSTTLRPFVTPTTPQRSTTSNDIPTPSNRLLPPKILANEVDTSTSDPRFFSKIVPAKDLQPPKSLKDRRDSNDSITSHTKLSSSNHTDNPSKVVQEAKLRDLRKIFFIPDYKFPLDPIKRPSYDSFSSYQVNAAGKAVNITNGIKIQKGQVNPDCPNCDPNLLVPGTCQPCIFTNR